MPRKVYPENTEKAIALIELAKWELDQVQIVIYYQEAVDILNDHISSINTSMRRRNGE